MLFGKITKLFSPKLLRTVSRCYCSGKIINKPTTDILFPFKNKKLLRLYGEDVTTYLQGLITNDMRRFEDGALSIYAMFLNNKGRVLFDTIIYKYHRDSYFLECDEKIAPLLQKHLLTYKLRRKIELEPADVLFNVWGLITNYAGEGEYIEDPKKSVVAYQDPRLPELGYRIIASSFLSGEEIAGHLAGSPVIYDDDSCYKYLRYQSGVAEGADDIPPGVRFPFELNSDYLRGVSFHKGCYIGQELTARVHHTGVVRKRIMPLKFSDPVSEELFNEDEPIKNALNPRMTVGKLKSVCCDYGLGLLRVKEALECKELSVKDETVEVVVPDWWPETEETPPDNVVITKE